MSHLRGATSGQNGEDDNVGSNCFSFYYKPGHCVRECTNYLRAKRQFHQSQKEKNEEKYAGLVANTGRQTNDEECMYPDARANIVIETALLSISKYNSNWKIDSGATWNLSGNTEDFSGLKRW